MDRLDVGFKERNKLNEQTKYTVFEMEPSELINQQRIGMLVKYNYVKARETGENIEFARELYSEYVKSFPSEIIEARDKQPQKTVEKYLEKFDEMIDRFKETGFDLERLVIPIGRNNEILTEAYQAACALYFNTKVKVMKFPDLVADYGIDFFRSRQLDAIYLDFLTKKYVKLKEEVYVLIVWPIGGRKEYQSFIEGEMEELGKKVVYHKQYQMTREVLEDVVFTVYRREHWIGFNWENFSGIKEKAGFGYDEKGKLVLYVLEGITLQQLVALKEKLRAHLAMGKLPIHTPDTYEESVEIATILLDQDYEYLLRKNYIERKDVEHTIIQFIQRKFQYYYQQAIHKLKIPPAVGMWRKD